MYAFRVCFGLQVHECNAVDIDKISESIESGGRRQESFIPDDNGGGDKSSLIGASNSPRSSQMSLSSDSCSWFDLDQFSSPAAPKLSKSYSKGRFFHECASTHSSKVDKYDLMSKKSAPKKPIKQVNIDILHLQKQYDLLKQSFEMLNSSTMIHRGKDKSSSTTNKVKVRRYPEDLVKPSRERKKGSTDREHNDTRWL